MTDCRSWFSGPGNRRGGKLLMIRTRSRDVRTAVSTGAEVSLSPGAIFEIGLRVALMLSGLGQVHAAPRPPFWKSPGSWPRIPDTHVEVFGAGAVAVPGVTNHVIACRPRERFEHWPKVPCFRGEGTYEESSFVWNLARSGRYRPNAFDVGVTCTYPWVNWFVQWSDRKRRRPVHVFVTQNGDWPCQARNREFRFFRCDGLVCTNPVFFERHRHRHRAVLIPNGVDPEVFFPRKPGSNLAVPEIDAEGGPAGKRVVFMASAMISSKDVAGGVARRIFRGKRSW